MFQSYDIHTAHALKIDSSPKFHKIPESKYVFNSKKNLPRIKFVVIACCNTEIRAFA